MGALGTVGRLRHYASSRMVAGCRPGEIIEFFSIYLILPSAVGPVIYSASNRNQYQKHTKIFLVRRARPARKADNLIPICEPIV
jgi:hypothetical protein